MAAQQEGGWPLGLQPLNVRVGLVRNRDFSGSMSSNTLITGSPSFSTDSSSDLDTESTGSFFHDKSITLGSLIGVSSILEFSRRSIRGRRAESIGSEKKIKSKTWLFSLCSKPSDTYVNVTSPPSLGQFLQVERKAANNYRRDQRPRNYEHGEFVQPDQMVSESNPLFVNGVVAPPQSSQFGSEVGRRHKKVYRLAVDVVHQFCYHVFVDSPATEKSPVHIFLSIHHCYMFIGFIVVNFHVLEVNKKSDI